EPAFGWPYDRIIKEAMAKIAEKEAKVGEAERHLAPEELAKVVVHAYVNHYSDYDRSAGRSADLAALSLTAMGDVKVAFTALVEALRKEGRHDAVLLAHWYAQTYKSDQFVDLKDLCVQIQKQFPNNDSVRVRCDEVIKAVRSCVVTSECSGFATQHSYGLS